LVTETKGFGCGAGLRGRGGVQRRWSGGTRDTKEKRKVSNWREPQAKRGFNSRGKRGRGQWRGREEMFGKRKSSGCRNSLKGGKWLEGSGKKISQN